MDEPSGMVHVRACLSNLFQQLSPTVNDTRSDGELVVVLLDSELPFPSYGPLVPGVGRQGAIIQSVQLHDGCVQNDILCKANTGHTYYLSKACEIAMRVGGYMENHTNCSTQCLNIGRTARVQQQYRLPTDVGHTKTKTWP